MLNAHPEMTIKCASRRDLCLIRNDLDVLTMSPTGNKILRILKSSGMQTRSPRTIAFIER